METPQLSVVDLSDKPHPHGKSPGIWLLSGRFQIALLLCLAVLVSGFARVNISMAMVCMLNYTAIKQLHNETYSLSSSNMSEEGCALSTAEFFEYNGDIVWDMPDQRWIFASVQLGQFITCLPAGWLADRCGPKNLMLISTMVSLLTSALTPIAAQSHFLAVFFLRVVTGMALGSLQPCIAAIIARWIPPDERATVGGIYTAGNQLCMVIGMPLFAWLCSNHKFLGGWPAIFYFCALVGLPWCALWAFRVSNSPRENRFLSEAERNYIDYCMRDQHIRSRKGSKVPWAQLVTSLPVWAVCVAFCCGVFSMITLQTYLPKYLKEVLYFDLKGNGLYSAAPFLCMLVIKTGLGYLADVIKRNSKFSRTVICKFFNSIASFGLAIFILGVSLLDCHSPILAVVFLCIGQGLSSGFIAGMGTSIQFLAPQYSGTVTSFVGFFAIMAGVAAPYVVSPLTANGLRDEWVTVFYIQAAVLTFGGSFFLLFGSGELQPWARIPEESGTMLDTINGNGIKNGKNAEQKLLTNGDKV